MKLTNYIRDAFITSVMDDVPSTDHFEQYRKVFLEAYLDTLPQEVQMVWISPALRPYAKMSCVRAMGQTFVVPYNCAYTSPSTPTKVQAKLAALCKAHDAQGVVRGELKAKIKSAAYACTTTKALRELLPEFDKYLPAEEEKTMRTLPVVQNIVADFVKAGWPAKKGAKK